MTDQPVVTSLTWKDCLARQRQLPGWVPSWIGFRYRWNDAMAWVSQELEARHLAGWSPRSEIHSVICRIAEIECGWEHGCFEPQDDLRVAFWAYQDGLDTEFAFNAIESHWGIVLSPSLREKAIRGSIESFIEIIQSLERV
ncbi:MAG: hypothetical protein ACK4XJ_02190 [Fimbriimonadaceae bacterium]